MNLTLHSLLDIFRYVNRLCGARALRQNLKVNVGWRSKWKFLLFFLSMKLNTIFLIESLHVSVRFLTVKTFFSYNGFALSN